MTCAIEFICKIQPGEWLTALIAAIGLFFVWWQTRQVRKQLTLQNYSEYTRRYSEIVLGLPEGVNEDGFGWSDLADKEKRRMRTFFDLCFEEWDLHCRKLISNKSWEVWFGGIETALKRDAFRSSWDVVRDTSDFGESFNAWMDCLACKKPQGGVHSASS